MLISFVQPAINAMAESANFYPAFTYGTPSWFGYVSSLCSSRAVRTSIIRVNENVLESASQLTIALGRILGMTNDYLVTSGQYVDRICPVDNSTCSRIGGFMDYYPLFPTRTQWSCCSQNDFKNFFLSKHIFGPLLTLSGHQKLTTRVFV